MSDKSRIARNTIFLFIRTLLVLGVSLYTSRIVLEVLGATDYGIYTVVAGVVAMLSFLNSAMVQASQRYMCIAQGQKVEVSRQRIVFSTSFFIHLTISAIVIIILETVGLWYVNNIMVLPKTSLWAANIIYQFSIFIFFTRIMLVPYTSAVVAREHFHIYAYISIADAILQLIGILLLKDIRFNKLISYVFILVLVALINYTFYYFYCKRHYKECSLCKVHDWSLFKEMIQFSSWAFLGGFGFIARTQGVNLVLNFFCGPAVNAARGMATQVTSAVQTLVSSFQQALNPQIIKLYAQGEKAEMESLVFMGAKYSFFLLLMVFTPILLRTSYVLSLWLVNIPQYTTQFLIMGICMCLVVAFTGPLITTFQATGNIKKFQIAVSLIMCMDIPLSYILLKLSVVPWLVTGGSVFTSICCLFCDLYLLRKQIEFNIQNFIKDVLGRCLIVIIITIPLLYALSIFIPLTFWGLILIIVSDIIIYPIMIISLGTNSFERKYISSKLKESFFRVCKKI